MIAIPEQKQCNSELFSDLPAYKQLVELAKHPINLTELLTSERIDKMVSHSAGFSLLYGTERIDSAILQQLQALASQTSALSWMHKMQQGEVVNFISGVASENRPALHTALRDQFNGAQTMPQAVNAKELAKQELQKIDAFLKEIEASDDSFTDLIIIGIGGSELGPQALFHALKHLKNPRRCLHFLSNIDPDAAASILCQVDLAHTLIAVLSKGGTTLETLTNEKLLREALKDQGLDAKRHIVAVTQKGSPLDCQESYREVFYLWPWVGGRYSVTSAIGAIPLGFACGLNCFYQLLQGAHEMDMAALQSDLAANLPLLGALLSIWNHNFLGYPTLAIIAYSHVLQRLAAHIQQVEMESNGKSIDRFGRKVGYNTATVIFGEPGTNAQHSFFQMLHQGTEVIPVEFIAFKQPAIGYDRTIASTTSQQKLLANLFAQAIALAQGQQNANPNKFFGGNRPSHILLANQATPQAVGALLAYYEHKTAFEGFILGINSFDQEGVQLGKGLTDQMLAQFIHKNSATMEQGPIFPLANAFLSQLERIGK